MLIYLHYICEFSIFSFLLSLLIQSICCWIWSNLSILSMVATVWLFFELKKKAKNLWKWKTSIEIDYVYLFINSFGFVRLFLISLLWPKQWLSSLLCNNCFFWWTFLLDLERRRCDFLVIFKVYEGFNPFGLDTKSSDRLYF